MYIKTMIKNKTARTDVYKCNVNQCCYVCTVHEIYI